MEHLLYELHARLCKTMSHPLRLQIINALRSREASVSRLAAEIGVGVGALSQHLNLMRNAGVLTARRQGNVVYYRVANPRMLVAFDTLREVLREQLAASGELAEALQEEGA